MQVVDVAAMAEYKEQAEAKHSHDVSCQRQKEEEEVPVVPPTDTVVHPWTVVVEVLQRIQKGKEIMQTLRTLYLSMDFIFKMIISVVVVSISCEVKEHLNMSFAEVNSAWILPPVGM